MITNIKAKLLGLVIVFMLAIIALAVGKIASGLDEKKSLEIAINRISEVEVLSKIIHFMQMERGLSVGFVASNGAKNAIAIKEVRSKVDGAVAEAKRVYASTQGEVSLFQNFNELSRKRAAIDSLLMNGLQTKEYYSKIITSLADTVTTVPARMSDQESRNIVQSSTHLSAAKEQLGQVRAILSVAFS
ncbi:MAG: methyl-accepting chemotaxis protein, partial [Campylobacterota bacterium]|nr:methyl-accepting chemotaxis protein [Campylobacterota bacterium]